jgi:putative peptidoglycan lipid II flippase
MASVDKVVAPSSTPKKSSSKAAAGMVAAGIFLSRIAGLVRSRIFAHYLGLSVAADAFNAAFKIPNFLQNLFGEGVLSASFIPVYARLRAEKKDEHAAKLAEAIFALLFATTTILVALGILATPWLMDVIAPGFKGDKRELTILLVRILFPGTGLLVMSAWCLGILNSHRKFFLSYVAPVIWNFALIAALLWRGGHVTESRLVEILAWASVAGSGLQFAIQLPVVLRFLWPLRLQLGAEREHVRAVLRGFGPVFVSRGVVQISAFIDSMLASLLGDGPVAALTYAQTLYTLPVSLFGMSVSAAELPAMSSVLGTADQVAEALRNRLARGLEQISYFVVPSAAAFLLLGDVIVATLFKTGVFGAKNVTFVWAVLAGSSVGLLASTSGRLYSSGFYALRNTRTPLKFACIRVALTLGLGYLSAVPLPLWLGIDRKWGAAGLTLSAGIAGWVEFALLRRGLQTRIGVVPYSISRLIKLWLAAVFATGVGYAVRRVSPSHHAVVTGMLVLVPYGVTYILLTEWMGISMVGSVMRVFRRR